MVSSFRFQVSRYFVPLRQGDEEQSSGGGLISTSVSLHCSFADPSALRAPRPNLGEERGSGFHISGFRSSAHRFPRPRSLLPAKIGIICCPLWHGTVCSSLLTGNGQCISVETEDGCHGCCRLLYGQNILGTYRTGWRKVPALPARS